MSRTPVLQKQHSPDCIDEVGSWSPLGRSSQRDAIDALITLRLDYATDRRRKDGIGEVDAEDQTELKRLRSLCGDGVELDMAWLGACRRTAAKTVHPLIPVARIHSARRSLRSGRPDPAVGLRPISHSA